MLTTEQITQQIEEVLEELRPYFFMHGGNITFDHYEDGKAYVKLSGTCSSCPASTYTLKLMIEENLKKEVPQVKEVIDIDDEFVPLR